MQEAMFIGYDGSSCILSTPIVKLKIRKSRLFTAGEADQHGLLTGWYPHEFVLLPRPAAICKK